MSRWQRLTELAKDRIDPPFNGKAIQQEHRRYIKKIFAEFNSIYEQLVPSEFFVDVPDATVKAEILQAAEAMLAEYQVMWNQYSALPFSLHHRNPVFKTCLNVFVNKQDKTQLIT